jgi:hypothetical protein
MPDRKETPLRPPWRFEVDSSEPAPRAMVPYEDYLDSAWIELQVIHTAFRGVEQAEYWTLIRKLQELELIFLDRPELDAYYRECYMDHRTFRDLHPEGFGEPQATRATDKVAAMQAQLMEDVFYILRLDRYGNARDNRGWMNLLRRWGRSPTFNKRFDELRSTFSQEFVAFYDLYLRKRYGTIDQSPIPHPWDRPKKFVPAGVFLDSGIREVARGEEDAGERPLPQPGSGAHGVRDEKGGAPMYENPPPSSDTEGGGSSSGSVPNV